MVPAPDLATPAIAVADSARPTGFVGSETPVEKALLVQSLFLFSLLWATLALPVVAETGVLYYAEGGTGGGLVHLLTRGQLMKLRWKKGQLLEQGFTGYQGWRPGAIWDYDQEEGYLVRARLQPQGSAPVRAAVGVVERHFALLRQGEWSKAYAHLSPAWKKQQSLDSFQRGNQKLSYRQDSAPSYALKVIGHNPREVLVLVNGLYFFEGEPGYFRYTLVSQGKSWYIDRVDIITAGDFQDS